MDTASDVSTAVTSAEATIDAAICLPGSTRYSARALRTARTSACTELNCRSAASSRASGASGWGHCATMIEAPSCGSRCQSSSVM